MGGCASGYGRRARRAWCWCWRERGADPDAAEPDGWWSVTTDRAAAGSRYRYRVDGGDYPDPASRYQPDGVHGASEVIDPAPIAGPIPAGAAAAGKRLVIYELHLGTFSESGDFAGAIARLDDLVALGVTAIELMPIAQFPGRRNWGYDGVQLFAPASAYGRPEDLKALVEACHARGLAILLDVVYNHFGPEGNYLHVIARDFFTERHHTPWGAAINYDGAASRPVRDFMIENALYWLEEYHFDGLRLDAVHAIIDDSDARYPDRDWRRPCGGGSPTAPVHLVLENDANEARRLRRQRRPAGRLHARSGTTICTTCCMCWRPGGPAAITATMPRSRSRMLGRALVERLCLSGRALALSRRRSRAASRRAICRRPPLSSFLQNHDQIGNTPFGERITADAPERAGPCGGRDRAAVAADPAPVHGRGMGDGTAVHVLLRFRAGAGRCGPRGASARVRAICRIRRGGGAGPHSRRDGREQLRCVPPGLVGARARAAPDWLERYRRMLLVRRDAIVPRLAGIGPGGAFRSARAGGAARGMDARRRRAAAAVRQFRRCGGAARRSAVRRNAAVLHRRGAAGGRDRTILRRVLSDPARCPPGGETR